MKILLIVPFLPNTSMSGGQTRWYNIIKYLSRDHEITLFSLIKDDSEKKFIPELKKYCKKVRVFKRSKSPWTPRNLALAMFTFYPLLVVRNWSPKEKKAIRKELEEEKYDLIHAETFYVMPHIPKGIVPTIMVEQTIEYQVYKHFVDNEVPLLLRPILMIDILKLRFWEKHSWEKTDQAVAVSETDKKIMQKLTPKIKVDVIPNGVDVAHFRQKEAKKKTPPRILFVGNFKWLQNTEALNILVDQVWPQIRAKYPKAILWIVGKSIPQRVINIANKRKDVETTEAIPDIRDAYKKATVMVVPLKGPGGTRLKVLEAMASNLPVVSTSTGVEGLNLTPGKHAIVTDSPKDLASQTVRLLKNKKLLVKIGEEGYRFVKQNFDWKQIVKLHSEIYDKAQKNFSQKYDK
jgi:glycosyltransferase involved in cell wall biosynthesis